MPIMRLDQPYQREIVQRIQNAALQLSKATPKTIFLNTMTKRQRLFHKRITWACRVQSLYVAQADLAGLKASP